MSHNSYWPSGTAVMLSLWSDDGEKRNYEICDFSPLIRVIESLDIRKVLPERLAETVAEKLQDAYGWGLQHAREEQDVSY